MNLLTLHLLLASTLAFAQDPTFINQPPPPPKSSELNRITTTVITQTSTSTFTTVVSYDSTVVVFQTSDEISGLRILTTITKPPGPPDTKLSHVMVTKTLSSTYTEYVSGPLSKSSTSSSSQPPPPASKSSTTSNTSTSKPPVVSIAPTPTPSTATSPPPKKGTGTLTIGLIVFGIVVSFAMVGAAAFFIKRRRGREVVEERNAAYRNREWNSARPTISSPLNTTNIAALNGMTTVRRSETPSNVAPARPARPASLSESVQESMRMIPVSGMRKTYGSVPSGGAAPTMMSGHRSLSPDPLNIVKGGTASRDRSETYSSTRPNYGDSVHKWRSSDIDSYQMDELRALERSMVYQEEALRVGEKDGYIQPLLIKESEPTTDSAEYSEHGHPSLPPIPPGLTYMQTLLRPGQPSFTDAEEEDAGIRAARRASAHRQLDGESTRPVSTPPRSYDSIAARAEKQRLIAQKQRLIAEQQKKDGGPGKNITDFSPGPMPNYSPPPPPGPSPRSSF